MTVLYCTADNIGETSGGGAATKHELLAMQEFTSDRLNTTRDISYSPLMVLNRDSLASGGEEPWKWDECAYQKIVGNRTIKLAHFYSGTFSKTVAELKKNGCKITYTIDAHDRFVSRQEHEKLNWGFPFPHLIEEKIWRKYIEGYRLADVIKTSGKVPEKSIRAYDGSSGFDFQNKTIKIIPYGCEFPESLAHFPANFTIGYMGSTGADKGVRYLLEAWNKLNYRDGSMLILAGKMWISPMGKHLLERFGGGCLSLMGWVADIADFYNAISCYVQPSATEGFGLEVTEAMAHGRPVLCSKAAGAQDLIPEECTFAPCNVDVLVNKIQLMKEYVKQNRSEKLSRGWQELAIPYTWDKIHKKYQDMWGEVLS